MASLIIQGVAGISLRSSIHRTIDFSCSLDGLSILQSSTQCKVLFPGSCSSSEMRISRGHKERSAWCCLQEPKWKQKLAAADEQAEKTRQANAQAQEEYRKRQAGIQRRQESISSELVRLDSLEFIPYLTDEGKIVECSKAEAKASVYAIFDEAKTLQYVGVTRAVYPSLKLHFARVPSKCYYVKVEHLTKPSRTVLESIRNKWVADNGTRPIGNDNGEQQNVWENPLDCKPLMTDEEKKIVEEAADGPRKAKALKNVARRLEASFHKIYLERNCTEKMWFDPKLKDKGLLELRNTVSTTAKREPDSAVPTTNLKAATVGTASV